MKVHAHFDQVVKVILSKNCQPALAQRGELLKGDTMQGSHPMFATIYQQSYKKPEGATGQVQWRIYFSNIYHAAHTLVQFLPQRLELCFLVLETSFLFMLIA